MHRGTRLREVLMSIRSMLVALAALSLATPAALRAQETEADFVGARKQLMAGQPRAAAQTLLMSSLHVRQQVGRCRTEDVGSRLIDAESQLEKLAAGIRAGTVGVKAMEKSLMEIDRVLAQHHLQLATANMAHPRADDIPVVAQDIDRGAFHFERSITLNGGVLVAEQLTAVTDARALVKEIETTSAIPKGAVAVVAALEKMVVAAATVSAAR
jgi:hypothetical protein